MANVTLSAITLDGDGNSFIKDNSSRKEAILTPMPFYLFDSDDTDVYDFGGTTKTFTLSGIYVGTTISSVKDFIDLLEGLIQGHQDISAGYPLTFTDTDTRGTKKVKVMDVETTKESGVPLMCTWNLKLIEASDNA